jgi:hypothetical protein
MDRITADASSTIYVRFYNDAEQLLDPDGQAVTVSVKDAAGTTVVASGAAVRESVGVYKKAVDLTVLDVYTASWTAAFGGNSQALSTQFEVIQAEAFTLAELRASNRALLEEPGLTRYTTEILREARNAAVERLERAMDVAITPRGHRATLSGDGSPLLIVPHLELRELYSCTADGTALSGVKRHLWGGLVHPTGNWPIGVNNVDVHYAHGFAEPPAPVKRAALLLAVDYVVPSNLPARATAQSTDLGQFRLSIAGREGPTGIPEVDAVIEAFGRARPAVGSAPAIG